MDLYGDSVLSGRHSDGDAQLTPRYASLEFRTLGWKFNLIMASVQVIIKARRTDNVAKREKPHSYSYYKGVPIFKDSLREVSLAKET